MAKKNEKVVEEVVEEVKETKTKPSTKKELVPEVTVKEDGVHKIDFTNLVPKEEKEEETKDSKKEKVEKIAEEVVEEVVEEKETTEETPAENTEPPVLEEISEEEIKEEVEDLAEEILLRKLEKLIERVRNQFDWLDEVPHEVQGVIIEMAYQMGLSNVKRFKLTLKHMQNQDWERAADEMLDSRWARQTPNRARELSNIIRSL